MFASARLGREDRVIEGAADTAGRDHEAPRLNRGRKATRSPALAGAFARSYMGLNASDLDDAVVALSNALAEQVPGLHREFELKRPLANDLFAIDLVTKRQVA